MKHYVGLDVSLKETAICIVDEAGKIIGEGKVLSEPEAIMAWLTPLDLFIGKVGLEIGGLARWLHDQLRAAGLPAVCIDPRRLRGLTKTIRSWGLRWAVWRGSLHGTSSTSLRNQIFWKSLI